MSPIVAITIIDRVIDQEAVLALRVVDQEANHKVDQEANHKVDQEVYLKVDHIVDLDHNYPTDEAGYQSINMDKYYEPNEMVNGYSIIKLIGEGRYGIVYLATNERNETFVMKQLKKETLDQTREKLFYEEQILQALKSPKFPKFISKFNNENCEGYILEYIEGKVFEDLLVRDRYQFSKDEIYNIGSQLLELIGELQDNNIVHRDIRLPNVILRENKELALIDFGLARIIDNERYAKEIDYWYLGDFLIYLYYSSYKEIDSAEQPWFMELDLNLEEKTFLKKLLGIEDAYQNIEEIKSQLEKIKKLNLP